MKKTLVLLLVATALLANASVIVDDTFGDGDVGTNTDGTGTGFTQEENSVTGDGTVTETSGQVQINAAVVNNHVTGIVSDDTLSVGASDTVTVTWDIASAANLGANGIELMLLQGTEFRGSTFLEIRVLGTGRIHEYINDSSVLYPDPYSDGSDVLDGFTATLTANTDGWIYTFTGLDITDDSSNPIASFSGDWGDSDFVTIMNGAHILTSVQGNASGGELVVNGITASVVPEPATTGLISCFSGVLFCIHRVFVI